MQAPELVYTTGRPELAVAATVKLPPYAALDGAFVLNVIVCGDCAKMLPGIKNAINRANKKRGDRE